MQFLTYSLVGCIATLAHYCLLIFLIEIFHLPPWRATLIGALFGALVGYIGNRGYTFSKTTNPHLLAFPRYIMIAVSGVISNGVLVWVGTDLLFLHYLMSQALATLIIFVLSYQLNKKWTFM